MEAKKFQMDGDAVSREIKVRAVCIFLVLMGEGIIWSDCTDKNACRGITLHAPKKIPLGDGCASCGGSSFEKTKEKLYANLHRVFLFPVHLTQVGIFAIFFMPLCHYFLSFFFFPSGGFSCRSCSAISSIICFFRYTSKASSQIKEKS